MCLFSSQSGRKGGWRRQGTRLGTSGEESHQRLRCAVVPQDCLRVGYLLFSDQVTSPSIRLHLYLSSCLEYFIVIFHLEFGDDAVFLSTLSFQPAPTLILRLGPLSQPSPRLPVIELSPLTGVDT